MPQYNAPATKDTTLGGETHAALTDLATSTHPNDHGNTQAAHTWHGSVAAGDHHAQSHTDTDHSTASRVTVRDVGGTPIGTRPNLKIMAGDGMFVTLADDAVNNEVDIIFDSNLATNAVLLGSAAAAGAAGTTFRSNDTIAAFDLTAPSTQAFGDAAAVGVIAFASRRDHKHQMPADPVTAHVAAADPHTGYVLESVVDVKGDLIVATAADTVARLAIGTNGQVPIADSAEVTGIRWGAAPAGGAPAFTTTEVNIAATPKLSGKFQITTAGQVTGKPVFVMQAHGPYTNKGSRADEAEMDTVVCSGKVLSATVIDVYWTSATFVKGNFKFDWLVGG